MNGPIDPCKGCVCKGCKDSDINGAVGVCLLRRCDKCNDDVTIRLTRCDNLRPLPEKGEPFTL